MIPPLCAFFRKYSLTWFPSIFPPVKIPPWWGFDSNDNSWGSVTGGFPPLNIMMMTIMIMKKTEQLISIHFNVDSPPLKITFFVRIAHGREVFERQDTILEIDQLGINMEDNIMSQRTELQKRTKKDDDI